MFSPSRLSQIFLIAIAIAVVGGSRSAQAGVLTDWNWSDSGLVGCSDVPDDSPKEDAFSDGAHSGMQGIPPSTSGGSHSVGMPSGVFLLTTLPITGLAVIADWALPDEPFLDGLPKPA